MKLLIQFFATLVICFILQFYLPWWTMALGAFAVAYGLGNTGYKSFFTGFLAIGLLWFGMAYAIDAATQSILTQKINRLLPVKALIITPIIGGLVGGLASLTGSLLKTRK
jgi:hypothetical protein